MKNNALGAQSFQSSTCDIVCNDKPTNGQSTVDLEEIKRTQCIFNIKN